MNLWIINNTKFGYKNNSKEWSQNMFDYFYNHFIPYITNKIKPGDKLIHLGNIMSNSETVNISILLKVTELFKTLSEILPVIILDGYNEKNNISTLFNVERINDVHTMDNLKLISNKNPLEYINNDDIVFINNRIDSDILKKYKDTLFFCGFHDDRKEDENIIHVGSPYQLDENILECGFYVLNTTLKKYKYIKNNYSPIYNTITITDVSQIEDIDQKFVENNNVRIIIDRSLVSDKKIKIDVLLSKYNFKSVTYLNEVKTVDEMDNSTTDMEELIREKIKKSDNENLLNEFENIIKIYRERY